MSQSNHQMLTEAASESERILFLPHNPHDVATARRIFSEAGIEVEACESLAGVVGRARRGVGVVLLAEERLEADDPGELMEFLEAQPGWSDLPVLVVTGASRPVGPVRELFEVANVTLLRRPMHIEPLVSSVKAALRDRRRQYDIRRTIANRDRFLAMLGHELRNPLSAIMLGLEQTEMSEDLSALEMLKRQSANLKRIVDDLLEVSRISRGAMAFDCEPVRFVEVVGQSVDAFEGIADQEGIDIHYSGPQAPPRQLWVEGDTVRLEQVLGNLLSNAVRYTPDGGSVEVRLERDGDQVVCTVLDSGMGIPADKLDKIFELFAQAHADFSRREGGLGLGLSLAHSIAESHGGTIEARSAGEGEGSEFSLRLPALARPVDADGPVERSAHADAAGQATDAAGAARLLVVEDVDDVREPFCDMLRLRGYEVAEAARGAEAIDQVEHASFDAIVLDIGLPDIDGFEVARRIRAEHPDVPLIALTGYGRDQDRTQARQSGFDILLTKPAKIDDLEAVLPKDLRA